MDIRFEEYKNGEYFLGQFKNNKRNGKGTLYYSNHEIKYEGNFVDDKFEGRGKMFFENGEYYIGEFKDNKMHGKGKLYYKNKKIKYKGIFTNGKYEKNYKSIILYFLIAIIILIISIVAFYIYSNENKNENNQKIILNDSNYYIGEIKNGKPNGKGKVYNKNNVLIYEGDFINGIKEGIGNMNLGDDKYYYGYFKNGKFNGKGILYKKLNETVYVDQPIEKEIFCIENEKRMKKKFNNITIINGGKFKKYDVMKIYEGEFINGEFNGIGIQLLQNYKNDFERYEGQFKNNKKEGKGIIFYKNGKKRYEGDFHDDDITGRGKYFHENDYYSLANFIEGKRNGKGKIFDNNNKLYYEEILKMIN